MEDLCCRFSWPHALVTNVLVLVKSALWIQGQDLCIVCLCKSFGGLMLASLQKHLGPRGDPPAVCCGHTNAWVVPLQAQG